MSSARARSTRTCASKSWRKRACAALSDAGRIRAAGGVVWRDGPNGVEVLLVHRPQYDDWTLPKGKLDAGETDEEAAVREVEEETGLRCRLGRELVRTDYVDGKGRPKTVRYWEMVAEAGAFEPGDEVDEIEWLPVDEAMGRLSYERDLPVLVEFTEQRG
jgi:8-oxo-dGTP diphosphatase